MFRWRGSVWNSCVNDPSAQWRSRTINQRLHFLRSMEMTRFCASTTVNSLDFFPLCFPFLLIHLYCAKMQSRKCRSVIKNSLPSLPVITARMLASITSPINPIDERCIILPPLRHPSPSVPLWLAALLAACLRRGFHPQASCDRSRRDGRISDKGHGPGALWERCRGLFSWIRSIRKQPRRNTPSLTPVPGITVSISTGVRCPCL